MDIGHRLKIVRKMFGFTQKEVGRKINIDQRLLSAYEANRARVPIVVLFQLSELYGYYSIDRLLGIDKPLEVKSEIETAYYRCNPEKRKIIDFILSLNN